MSPNMPWTGIVRGDEPVVGIPPLDKNNPQSYERVRKEVDKLRLTGTIAIEGDEYVLYLHWNTESIRLVVFGNGKPNQDTNCSANVAGSEHGSLQA